MRNDGFDGVWHMEDPILLDKLQASKHRANSSSYIYILKKGLPVQYEQGVNRVSRYSCVLAALRWVPEALAEKPDAVFSIAYAVSIVKQSFDVQILTSSHSFNSGMRDERYWIRGEVKTLQRCMRDLACKIICSGWAIEIRLTLPHPEDEQTVGHASDPSFEYQT